MPINLNYIQKYLDSFTKNFNNLEEGLDKLNQLNKKSVPSIPRTINWSAKERDERLKFLEEQNINFEYLTGKKQINEVENLRGNIENFIGFTKVPTGIAGPIRINGLNAQGDYFIPLATTEGALVASISRGCSQIRKSGGVRVVTLAENISRAPVFVFENLVEVTKFLKWVSESYENFKDVAEKTTRHGRLQNIQTVVMGSIVHLICSYKTGDASGQNMVTIATDAICKYVAKNSPIKPSKSFIDGNLSSDKKSSYISFLGTRGKLVVAECEILKDVVEKNLHTTSEKIFSCWKTALLGGVQSGSIGVQGHYSNTLTAMFMACGQDVACVSEASVGITNCEIKDNGNLYLSVTLPNMIVGTVGGGCSLPTQKECLKMLGCNGAENAAKFAEICASVVLAGELSIIGAIASGEFTLAHQMLGR